MSRIRVPLDNPKHTLLVGWDGPFGTYFAMLYTPALNSERLEDEPDKAVGYHPMERIPGEITEHGPYPCDLDMLFTTLQGWGLSEQEVTDAIFVARHDGPR